MQRDHDAANNDDHEQKDYEQTEPQTEFFANNWENEIRVCVRQIKHFLATIAQTESFHSSATPGNQCLHLLQAGVFLVVLGGEKSGDPPHTSGEAAGNKQKRAKAGERDHPEPQWIRSCNKHDDKRGGSQQSCRSQIDFSQNKSRGDADDCKGKNKSKEKIAPCFFASRKPGSGENNCGKLR